MHTHFGHRLRDCLNCAPGTRRILREEVLSEHPTEDASLMKQAVDEVSRYRSMDKLIPSPKNVVTTAALEVSNLVLERVCLP